MFSTLTQEERVNAPQPEHVKEVPTSTANPAGIKCGQLDAALQHVLEAQSQSEGNLMEIEVKHKDISCSGVYNERQQLVRLVGN